MTTGEPLSGPESDETYQGGGTPADEALRMASQSLRRVARDARAGRDVYIAAKPHRCDPPDRPLGSVWRCQCGRYLYASHTDGCVPSSSVWTLVRWFHIRVRLRIRQTDGQFRRFPAGQLSAQRDIPNPPEARDQ